MKAATVNFKTDEQTKRKAQDVASKLGIPLSNLLNAYLYELEIQPSSSDSSEHTT
jgi:antitoxin component of RelBE/YafQ-DinJ toxin-antitoxin module